MFDNLRAAFREAVENFKEELSRDEVPEAVDRLLRGMRDEVTDAKTRLHDLEVGIGRARAEAQREREELATCERREAMARRIGDEETARVAEEFGAKHARRAEVLEAKAVALERELEVRKSEIDEMLGQLKEAQAKRDSLAASAGRASANQSIRGAEDLFDELDRMAEVIGDESDRRAAFDDLAASLDPELGVDPEEPNGPSIDVDARLAELKRRMGRE